MLGGKHTGKSQVGYVGVVRARLRSFQPDGVASTDRVVIARGTRTSQAEWPRVVMTSWRSCRFIAVRDGQVGGRDRQARIVMATQRSCEIRGGRGI